MKYDVIFTALANDDFYKIIDFISIDSPQDALIFVGKLQSRIKNNLSVLPFSGVRYQNEIRYFIYDNYVVVYEPIEKEKQVLVYHISQASKR